MLDDYWSDAAQRFAGPFPFPSMSGSGDRMAICWAVFGKPPDLATGSIRRRRACSTILPGHRLQRHAGAWARSCAEVTVFHTCKGSNGCQAQGGCGFVQLTDGRRQLLERDVDRDGQGDADVRRRQPLHAARRPSTDAWAAATRSPARPIRRPATTSAADLRRLRGADLGLAGLPASGHMQLFDFKQVDGKWTSVLLDGQKMRLRGGRAVLRRRLEGLLPGDGPARDPSGRRPPPTPLRLAFPPST